MSLVKVWNDNKYPFSDTFKGDKITIGPGEHIEMDWDDAVEFRGQFYPPEFDGSGNQKAQSFKMIRVEGKPPHYESAKWTCAACGQGFANKQGLDDHVDMFHLDELEDQKIADKRKKGTGKNV